MKIACWSGPRNISTALMRSWSSRNDTFISDEPLYASYLKSKKIKHPMHEEIISKHESDYKKIIKNITGSIPKRKVIWYQKHMAHHIKENESLDWINSFRNCLLIREPKYVISSYIKKNKLNSILELGYYQQNIILNYLIENEMEFIVIDSHSFLNNPQKYLSLWCEKLNIEFSKEMLKWEKKIYKFDGIWAKHWYKNVINSDKFFKPKSKIEEIPKKYNDILQDSNSYYSKLKKYELSFCK